LPREIDIHKFTLFSTGDDVYGRKNWKWARAIEPLKKISIWVINKIE
jgi:hypothetical protein